MFRLKNVKIQCSRCHSKIEIDSGDFDYESSAVDERSMGTEYQHTWTLIEKECTKEKCKGLFSIEINMWEYPIGIANYQDQSVEGAIFVENPEIEEEPDEDD